MSNQQLQRPAKTISRTLKFDTELWGQVHELAEAGGTCITQVITMALRAYLPETAAGRAALLQTVGEVMSDVEQHGRGCVVLSLEGQTLDVRRGTPLPIEQQEPAPAVESEGDADL